MEKLVTEQKISLDNLLEACNVPEAGAQVLFCGRVRNHHKNKTVKGLEYSAYEPMASEMIKQIMEEAIVKYGLYHAHCIHRTGKVEIEGVAVVVVTSSAHRKEAYEANRYILDRVKYEVPIWKKEFFEDGVIEWGKNSDQKPMF